MKDSFDVVVIGGGTAGLVTASGCARLGRKVALIEREKLGGDCLWTGCVPTKALVATAKLAHQMRNADQFGLSPHEPTITPASIMESMRRARRAIEPHDDPAKFRALGIDVIEGEARFVARDRVEVGGRVLTARDVVVATGSRTAIPPVTGLEDTGFLDHASFLAQDDFPSSVIILGGGYIGIEFAQIFRRFGSDVTVVEMFPEIIGREDADVIRFVRERLEDEGIRILTGHKAVEATRTRSGKSLRVETPGKESLVLDASEIFVASGRRGNIEGLGLEEIGVRTERRYIVTDDYLATTVDHVWACGDVHGRLQFTHSAAYEAVKLVRNILFPGRSKVDYDDIPWALFTDPEVGHIGMTEGEAREQHGDAVQVYRVEMHDVDRAVVDRSPAGFLKIICDRKGRILGAHVVGSHASTLVEELVLARRQGLKISNLAGLISPYPSLADAVQKAAALYYRDVGDGWLGSVARRIAALTQ